MMKKRSFLLVALMLFSVSLFATPVVVTWEWMLEDPDVTVFRYQVNGENPDQWTVVDSSVTSHTEKGLDGSKVHTLYLQQSYDGVYFSGSAKAESEVIFPPMEGDDEFATEEFVAEEFAVDEVIADEVVEEAVVVDEVVVDEVIEEAVVADEVVAPVVEKTVLPYGVQEILKSEGSDIFDLFIVHTNDLKGNIYTENGGIGVARLSTMATVGRSITDNYLMLNTGNVGEIPAVMAMTAAELVDWIGYDAYTPQAVQLATGITGTKKALPLSVNALDAEGYLVAQPYQVYNFNGFTVGVVGLVAPKPIQGISFDSDLVFENAQYAVDMARSLVDYVVVLGDLGSESDLSSEMVCQNIDGIDLFVDGNGDAMAKTVNGTLIVRADSELRSIGAVQLHVEYGKVTATYPVILPAADVLDPMNSAIAASYEPMANEMGYTLMTTLPEDPAVVALIGASPVVKAVVAAPVKVAEVEKPAVAAPAEVAEVEKPAVVAPVEVAEVEKPVVVEPVAVAEVAEVEMPTEPAPVKVAEKPVIAASIEVPEAGSRFKTTVTLGTGFSYTNDTINDTTAVPPLTFEDWNIATELGLQLKNIVSMNKIVGLGLDLGFAYTPYLSTDYSVKRFDFTHTGTLSLAPMLNIQLDEEGKFGLNLGTGGFVTYGPDFNSTKNKNYMAGLFTQFGLGYHFDSKFSMGFNTRFSLVLTETSVPMFVDSKVYLGYSF